MTETIVIKYDPKEGRLSRAFETDDLLGAVQRGQAEVNDALGHLLRIILSWLNIEKVVPESFGPKIQMMEKYCNIPIRIEPLRLLNKIRNPIMKDGEENLSENELERLFCSVSAMYGGRVTKRFRDVKSGLTYSDMTTSQKYVFLSAAIMFGIAATEIELEQAVSKAVLE